MNCPVCNIDMKLLVAGIFECPQCKKIIKEKSIEIEKIEKEESLIGNLIDGEWFHKNVSLNKRYEIADCGYILSKTDTRMFAILICHNPLLKSEKYMRLSWWKKSFYQHAGQFKIYDKEVFKNIIVSLEKIEKDFDEVWSFQGKYVRKEPKTEEQKEKEKKLDIIKYRILENKTCPKCQKKMVKKKSHYECPHCGEIVILEGYNQPIFNIDPSDLDLNFHGEFPINFYLPVAGITVKKLMGEWKALVVIYSKDNPNKKWLRLYWWTRDLQNIMKYGQREMGEGTQMGWKAQKGVASPNIYNMKLIKPLIEALKNIANEMNWDIQDN